MHISLTTSLDYSKKLQVFPFLTKSYQMLFQECAQESSNSNNASDVLFDSHSMCQNRTEFPYEKKELREISINTMRYRTAL
jgi:hypothetical protein